MTPETVRHYAAVAVDFADDERRVLEEGLGQTGGPGAPSEELAVGLGFANLGDLFAESARIRAVLSEGNALSDRDAVRALILTEISFVSDCFGAGVEWETVTGLRDDDTIAVLRRLQRKLVGSYRAIFDA
jgi:hypothetical protein